MELHGDIMNLRVPAYVESLPDIERKVAFKTGHKVARHDAAELALKYEVALEEAILYLTELADTCDDDTIRFAANLRLVGIQKIIDEKF
jgi:hypothetical protein